MASYEELTSSNHTDNELLYKNNLSHQDFPIGSNRSINEFSSSSSYQNSNFRPLKRYYSLSISDSSSGSDDYSYRSIDEKRRRIYSCTGIVISLIGLCLYVLTNDEHNLSMALSGGSLSSRNTGTSHIEYKSSFIASNYQHSTPIDNKRIPKECVVATSSHEGISSVKVLETSLAKPSEPWNHIECSTTKQDFKDYVKKDSFARLLVNTENVAYQRIIGFGGAFTEATSLNFQSLSKKGQELALNLLFSPSEGLGYTLGRVPIDSSDFSVNNYNFDSQDQDFELTNFDHTLQHDQENGMHDMIRRANDITTSTGVALKIVASPWSPPAWLKRDEEPHQTMDGSSYPGCIKDGTSNSKYAETWAQYFSKWISSFQNLTSVNVYAVTVQNEPTNVDAIWEGCYYNAQQEKDFVSNYLSPILKRDFEESIQILGWDYNMKGALPYAQELLATDDMNTSPPAVNLVDGIALHWYSDGPDEAGLWGALGAANVHRLNEQLSALNKQILDTEACHCPSTGYALGDLNESWWRGERYAHAIMSRLASGSTGFIEWNMILDSIGGPNHADNLCDAPIIAVPNRARDEEHVGDSDVLMIPTLPDFEHHSMKKGEMIVGNHLSLSQLNEVMGYNEAYLKEGLVVQPMFYYMGHISKFVTRGSTPLNAIVDSSETYTFTSLENKGGKNGNARDGMELNLWPCEGSSRQSWNWDSKKGRLYVKEYNNEDKLLCVGREVDPDLNGLTLVPCEVETAASLKLELLSKDHKSGEKSVQFVVLDESNEEKTIGRMLKFLKKIQTKKKNNNSCLVIEPLANNGGAYGVRGGAQLSIGSCEDISATWILDEKLGKVSSNFYNPRRHSSSSTNLIDYGEVCLTTGWPFLQMNAFKTPDSETVLVILNEADEFANYRLQYCGDDNKPRTVLESHIPARSIQTIVL